MKINKITVLGAGIWGSVIAQHLAKKGYNVALWEYNEHLLNVLKTMGRHPNIPNFKLHDNIRLTGDVAEAVQDTDLIIFVISSKAIRSFCRKQLKPLLNGRAVPVVSASKGIEDKTFKTICELIEEELPQLKDKALAFSGPSFALEVAQDVPTKIMLAGKDPALVDEIRDVMSGDPIIVVPASDRRGVEYGGGIKNRRHWRRSQLQGGADYAGHAGNERYYRQPRGPAGHRLQLGRIWRCDFNRYVRHLPQPPLGRKAGLGPLVGRSQERSGHHRRRRKLRAKRIRHRTQKQFKNPDFGRYLANCLPRQKALGAAARHGIYQPGQQII